MQVQGQGCGGGRCLELGRSIVRTYGCQYYLSFAATHYFRSHNAGLWCWRRARLTSSVSPKQSNQTWWACPSCFLHPRGFHFNIKLRQSLQPQRGRVHRSSDGDWFWCLKWVTMENWVFETFDPLNQSLRLCGNPYVHTSSTHCLLIRTDLHTDPKRDNH